MPLISASGGRNRWVSTGEVTQGYIVRTLSQKTKQKTTKNTGKKTLRFRALSKKKGFPLTDIQ